MAKSKQKLNSSTKSRKQIRKEKRKLKKVKRNEYYASKAKSKCVVSSKDDTVNASEDTHDDDLSIQSEKKHCEETATCTLDQQMKQKRKEDMQFKKLERKMKAQRLRQLREENEKDDKMIRSLEKKLRLHRRKSRTLPKSFAAEGLDYLLDVCGYGGHKDALNLEKELCESGVDFEDDLAVITESKKKIENKRNNSKKKEASKTEVDDHISGSVIQGFFDGDDFNMGCDEENVEDDYDDWHSDSEGVDGNEEDISKQVHEEDEDEGPKPLKEDIYGRLRDEKGNIVENNESKYIPPQLREKSSSKVLEKNEYLHRLSKQMKGYLNRLTGNNMHSISSQMEDLYMRHSRYDVNFVLLKLFRDSLITNVLSPDRIIIEHALLISILHANVGTEIGAHILQHMIEDFNKLVNENSPLEDKRIHNIVVFLCQLYNFKIFNASLIYEVLKIIVDKFQERDIDLILLVLKNVGFNLRKDNPVLLKELICTIQQKANESSALRENTRVRFMLETLTAVKNNMLKVQHYDHSYVDHLKKIQKNLLRQGKYISELKISLDDLLNADTKGRWWIVGSAWTGSLGNKGDRISGTSTTMCSFDQKILDLAKKQRMNTDTRKNIFCILMSSEDYVDAFDKLMKLGLKGQQYQDIIYVLMHCILKEKKYNPYYSYIAEQLCLADRKYQLAIQFATWDRFKDIESLNNVQITNLAKFLGYLFLEQKLSLSVLKVLQFSEMNKHTVRLIRQIVLVILLSKDDTVIVDIFSRISKSEKLLMLREGLQLFLHHFVLKNIGTSVDGECEETILQLPKHVELAINAMRGSSLS